MSDFIRFEYDTDKPSSLDDWLAKRMDQVDAEIYYLNHVGREKNQKKIDVLQKELTKLCEKHNMLKKWYKA